jgi:6-phosphogluconolactonase
MEPDLVVAGDEADLALRAAEWLAQAVREAVARRGRCSLALSGGSTPRPAYERLAALAGVPWDAVEIYFGDERAVPPADPHSNYRMAREALLDRLPQAPAAVHRMEAEDADREAAAARYAARLPAALDLLVLGMGPDGHTASLFPGSPALRETERKVVPARAPVPPHDRLTVTPPVIEAARHVAVLVAGAAKAPLVARVLRGPWRPDELPAQLACGGTWLLDRAAAADLAPRP